jgi:thioredoxin-related protein
MKNIYISLLLVCISFSAKSQSINWISFEEAIALNKELPKNILVDVYTDWCGYCKKMDRDTYKNTIIAEIINENFYAVKLNAEQKEPITYNGKEYKFVKKGRKGYHEFAANILNGEMSYPSTIIMDTNERLVQKLPGYLGPKRIEPILIYLGKEKYLEISWEEFQKDFSSNL